MPKVNREEYHWTPVGKIRETIYREIYFSSKRNKFYAPLPEIVAKLLDKKDVEGNTLEEAKNNWNAALQEYIDRNTKKKKVIAYKVEAQAIIYKYKNGEIVKTLFRREDIDDWDNRNCVGLTLGYIVCFETIYNKEKEYVDEDNQNVRVHTDYKIVDWTPQREEFFKEIKTRLALMVQKMTEFLEDKKLPTVIDTGMKMLPYLKEVSCPNPPL